MNIGHQKISAEADYLNSFVAIDDDGKTAGTCVILKRKVSAMFPDTPIQYEIRAQGEERALLVLYGAAVARVRLLAKDLRVPARVYANVPVGDAQSLQVLHALGFRDGDGIVRMYRRVTSKMNLVRMPEGCTIVRDFLSDPQERSFFLERYSAYYGQKQSDEWLGAIRAQKDFARILMVSPNDLCGELLVWTQDGMGVIGFVQTARKWRRMGVASYLLEDARLYFASLGLEYAQFDVWQSAPGVKPLAVGAGYTGGDPVCLYPGMNL